MASRCRAILCALILGLGFAAPVLADGLVQWEPTGGPIGAPVRALVVLPLNPDTLLAGTLNGIYRSTDNGESWQHVSGGRLECQEIHVLDAEPQRNGYVYTGGSDGLFRGQDNGATWARVGSGLSDDLVLSFAIGSGEPHTLYAGVNGSVFVSTDQGDRWQAAGEGLPKTGVWCLAAQPGDPRRVLAGTDSGVYISDDAGQRWTASALGLPANARVEDLEWHPQDTSRVYAATDAGLYLSTDKGRAWAAVPTLVNKRISALHLFAADPRIALANVDLDTVWRSTNGGQDWSPLAPLPEDGLVLAITTHPYNPQWIYVGTDYGFVSSRDGGESWQVRNEGLTGRDARTLVDVPGTKDELYVATRGGIYRTADGGVVWEPRNSGLPELDMLSLAIDPGAQDRLYALTWSGDLYLTQDGGQHWGFASESPTANTPPSAWLVTAQAEQELGAVWIGDASHGVWLSLDGARTWQPMNQGLADLRVGAIAGVASKPDVILLGAGSDVYRWVATRHEWSRMTEQPLEGRVSDIVVDGRWSGHAYVATEAGAIYRGRWDGSSWESVSQQMLASNLRVNALELVMTRSGRRVLCATTSGGIYCSRDEGATWSLSSVGCLYGTNVRCLVADEEQRGTMYLGTARSSVYRGVDRSRAVPLPVLYVSGAVLFGAAILAVRTVRRQQAAQSILHERGQFEEHWDSWNRSIEQMLVTQHRVSAKSLASEIPDGVMALAMHRYLDTHRDQDLVFTQDPLMIEPRRHADLERFASNWRSLIERLDETGSATPIAARITEQLCDLLGFSELSNRTYKSLFGYMVRASTLRLSIPVSFPIVFVLKDHLIPDDVRDVRDLMHVLNATSFFALLIVVSQDPVDRKPAVALKQMVRSGADDFIVLDYQDLCRLYLATDSERQLVNMILEQVDLTVVSPYVISGPVSGNMFFGRDYELKAITRTVRDRSYAIVGGRKIGKTSVLTKVHELLQHTSGFSAIYLDCQHVTNYQEFFDTLAITCQLDVGSAAPDALRRIAVRMRRRYSGSTLVMLLDEVDHLLAYDTEQQMRLFRVMRALSQEGICRFVFCGERGLDSALHDPQSPLFNFCNIMRLSYLLARDARRIITEPMAEMGVSFEEPEQLPEAIIELSSCHPNLVQAICRMLIMHANERGDHAIRMEDLDAVRASDEFREFFFEVTWGNADVLERLVTVLMADQESFTLEVIEERLAALGVRLSGYRVKQAIDGLVLFSILSREGHAYRFAAQSFPRIVQESGLLNGLQRSLLEQVRDPLA